MVVVPVYVFPSSVHWLAVTAAAFLQPGAVIIIIITASIFISFFIIVIYVNFKLPDTQQHHHSHFAKLHLLYLPNNPDYWGCFAAKHTVSSKNPDIAGCIY